MRRKKDTETDNTKQTRGDKWWLISLQMVDQESDWREGKKETPVSAWDFRPGECLEGSQKETHMSARDFRLGE